MNYTLDLVYLAGALRNHLKIALKNFPEIGDRLTGGVPNQSVLYETIVRIAWNVINQHAEYPVDELDEEGAICEWFEDYTLDVVDFDRKGIEIYDRASLDLFREVIDLFSLDVVSYIKSIGLRGDWRWVEVEFTYIGRGVIIVKNKGDFRIRDWERLKDLYEGS